MASLVSQFLLDSAFGFTLLMFHGLLAPIAYDHDLVHGLARPCPGHVQWGGTGNPGDLGSHETGKPDTLEQLQMAIAWPGHGGPGSRAMHDP